MLEDALLLFELSDDETSADRVAVLGGGRGVLVDVAVELQATRSKNRVMSAMLESTWRISFSLVWSWLINV
jgi:hypothetical protein